MNYGKNFYKCLPINVLEQFYFEIKKNIKQNILTEAMYVELGLIEAAIREQQSSFADINTPTDQKPPFHPNFNTHKKHDTF